MLNRVFSTVATALLAAACAHPTSLARGAQPTPASVDLVVAATTDIHGRVRGWDYDVDRPDSLVGLARAATIVDSLRLAAPERVVLVDAGDITQGNALTFLPAPVPRDSAPT